MLTDKWIMDRVKEWAATPYGRKVIKEKTGITYSPEEDAHKLVQKAALDMKMILFKHIMSDGNHRVDRPKVIDSLKISDIVVGEIYKGNDGKLKVDVGFDPSKLHRDSLAPDVFPEGIENIVLLHMTGYHARSYVFGYWEGHNGIGNTRSLKDRASNDFMQRAIDEFNTKYKDIAIAKLQNEYNLDN